MCSDGTDQVPDCSHGSGHKWETVDVAIEGRGSGTTYVVMECSLCKDLLLEHGRKVIAEVGRNV